MNGREKQTAYIRWFSDTGIDDVAVVGGKNASLGEMYRELAPQGVRVPNGFAVTAAAYRHFMRESGLDRQVRDILSDLDTGDIGNLRERGRRVRHAVLAAELPADVQQAIVDSYDSLGAGHAEPLDVAVRSSATLEVYVMCEIPSNVILAEQFAEVFDGFSIGSNDLTQLVLGVDRDSEIVAHIFDERNDAVKRMIADVIRKAKAAGCKIGICGQAPSDYPEFAAFLVEEGIDSISLNPDSILKTTATILEQEAKTS